MRRREFPDEGITRRTILKGGLAAGAAGFLGLTAYGTIQSLISPQREGSGAVNSGFVYAAPQDPKLPVWYENLVGRDARLDDFEPGTGAGVRWKAIIDEEGQTSFPGFPALLIRTDEDILQFPEGSPRNEYVIQGLFAIFNCCTHACCPPGYQLLPRSAYVVDPGFETIYCECHFSQYDPKRIERYSHPPPPEASGANYLGVYKIPGMGPADRGMPLIPISLQGSRVVGGVRNPEWYRYLTWRDTVIPE